MIAHNLKEGLIITEKESGKLKIDDREIQIKPVYEWLNDIRK